MLFHKMIFELVLLNHALLCLIIGFEVKLVGEGLSSNFLNGGIGCQNEMA